MPNRDSAVLGFPQTRPYAMSSLMIMCRLGCVSSDQEGLQVRPMVPEGIDAEEFQKINASSNITVQDSTNAVPSTKCISSSSSTPPLFCVFVHQFRMLDPSRRRPKSSSWRRPRIRVTDAIHSPEIRPRSCNSPTRTHPRNHPPFPHRSRTRGEPSRRLMM